MVSVDVLESYIERKAEERAAKKVVKLIGGLLLGGLAIVGAKSLYDKWEERKENQQ